VGVNSNVLRPCTLRACCFLAAATTGPVCAQPANVSLPTPVYGAAAVGALGNQLPDVANAYGLQAQELVNLLRTQPALGVDKAGALVVVCDGLAVSDDTRLVDGGTGPSDTTTPEADALTAESSITLLASGSSVDAFKLHSLPGVKRVIYLDFDGHVTSGTSWIASYASGAPITSGAPEA
jgi:hypothetical protein